MRYLGEMKAQVERLAEALPIFEAKVGHPEFMEDRGFRYRSPDGRTIQVLLCVRIVSGLHAALLLCSYGHVIEAGVILRTVDDFFGDIVFVEEANRSATPTAVQQKFIDNYFLESHDPAKQQITRRQKVRTAEGRFLSEDWYSVAGITKMIDVGYDSYVHGEYGPNMDIYVGGSRPRFEALGVRGTPPITTFRLAVGCAIHRAYAMFGILALRWRLRSLAESLDAERRAFEQSDAHVREHDP